GRWKEVEVLELQVMETFKKVLREDHLSNTPASKATWRRRRWKEAKELFVQVMETSARVLREEHLDTLTSIANSARVNVQELRAVEGS
ncbi:uncharacterized protein BDR25DRAFT_213750, partial [Lindgomyces ingoldianus]